MYAVAGSIIGLSPSRVRSSARRPDMSSAG
jgi:hypothetical protein